MLQILFALGISYFDRAGNAGISVLAYLALAMSVWFAARYLSGFNRWLGILLLLLSLIYILFSNGASLGLFVFSGQGFTSEVFFHLEPTTFLVAWNEFAPGLVIGFTLVTTVLAHLLYQFSRATMQPGFDQPRAWQVAIILVLTVITISYTPPFSLAQQWQVYRSYEYTVAQLPAADYLPYQQAGIINSLEVLDKSALEVTAPANPPNLLLIYLESFNHGLTNHPRYPELTPAINAMQQSYASTSKHFASAFVTIEGIIGSQCGTLLPMFRGNDSLMGLRSVMPAMACLGDVLKEAGYNQNFLGGAPMEFAGKGLFLHSHGYDVVQGWEHWREQGKSQRTGVWGLSDPELFAEAVAVIKQAAKSPPYHLSLLTLGTHLPGFLYEECQPYAPDAPKFINAVHCTDQLLGKFLATLEKQQLLENTQVFITGDHGVFSTMEMHDLFGEMVNDRRILTLTWPERNLPPDWPMATFDIAPTLLDLLGIKHNQHFLYGQSVLKPAADRFFVTRYGDWVAGRLQNSKDSSCESPIDGRTSPLSKCQKRKLLVATQAKLDSFASRPENQLSCLTPDFLEVDQIDGADSYSIKLGQQDARQAFTREGYYLNKLEAGFYVVELDQYNDLLAGNYFSLSDDDQSRLARRLKAWPQQHRLMLVYLAEPDHAVTEPLATAMKDLGLDLQGSAVQVAYADGDKGTSERYPIDSMPFSLGWEKCQQLLAQ